MFKIKRLIRELASVLSLNDLKKALGATAMLFGLTFSNPATAQSFAAPVINPFSINPQSYLSSPAMADLDDDGDIDLLIGGYYGLINYFENEGTNEYPQFKLPVSYPFGLDSISRISFPTFADLDDDGDMDLLAGEYYGQLRYFENRTITGIEEVNKEFDIRISPNPAADFLNIQTKEEIERVRIMDMTARNTVLIEQAALQIPIANLRPGMYLLHIKLRNGDEAIRKFVKKMRSGKPLLTFSDGIPS